MSRNGFVDIEGPQSVPVELADGDVIVFDEMTRDYGRAEFDFCSRRLRGKIVEIHVSRRQQARKPHWFVVKVKTDGFSIMDGSAVPQRNVAPWIYSPCATHGMRMSVYVPAGTSGLRVRKSCVNTRFEFE